MRYTADFHHEWGYLAPTSSFIRTARVVLVATAVGATAGAGVAFSLVSHPVGETSVAARTLVGPVEAASARANAPAQVAPTSTPSPTDKQQPPSLEVNGQSAHVATNESSASLTTQAPKDIAALAQAPAATDGPAKAAIAAPPAAAKVPVVDVTPIKKKATKKPNVTWRYASRDEPLGLVPSEYYTRRSSDEYHASGARGAYYRDGGRWGAGGGRRYQD
jgi:hypothetical protein